LRLGSCSWPELAHGNPPRLLVPLGATEQHGPHLPLCTDTTIVVAIADGAAREHSEVVVAPALPFGASGEHAGFPGTLSLGLDALEHALVELVRSADHFADVVLVCWHGGNAEPVARAVRRSRDDGRVVNRWQPRLPKWCRRTCRLGRDLADVGHRSRACASRTPRRCVGAAAFPDGVVAPRGRQVCLSERRARRCRVGLDRHRP
jgi:hypothetical protein